MRKRRLLAQCGRGSSAAENASGRWRQMAVAGNGILTAGGSRGGNCRGNSMTSKGTGRPVIERSTRDRVMGSY